MKNVLTVILAGGQGERLYPLTKDRAKPAVPFGGKYRIIDFTLNNCINSSCRKILVLIQYKSISLEKHLRQGWSFLPRELGEYIDTIAPQQRVGKDWYRGTSDAIYQNFYSIKSENQDYVLILSGDHIYKMDYRKMLNFHKEIGADLTVGTIQYPIDKASSFGIIEVDSGGRVIGFKEKPKEPKTIPGDPNHCLVSMGIYIFCFSKLYERLMQDTADQKSSHDFGKNILPKMIPQDKVYSYIFEDENKKEEKYWRDVGSIDSYFEANMDLVGVDPVFNLYDMDWPVRTFQGLYPPGKILDAMLLISEGCIIDFNCHPYRSILSPNVKIGRGTNIVDSIIFDNVQIGDGVRIKKAIIDKYVKIPSGTQIGFDIEADMEKYFVTDSGIVVVSKETDAFSHF